jgi:DNA-directed RNA polymerase subunit beta'
VHGPAQIGDNVGVDAAMSLGERGAQLAMRSFHSGGFGELPPLDQVASLLRLPENLPDKAVLMAMAGRVDGLERVPDGTWVHVTDGKGKERFFAPVNKAIIVKKGQTVKAGEALTSGVVDPREVLAITKSLPAAQRSLTDSLVGLYKKFGIDARNVEVLVRSMTNLAVVDDAGTSDKLVGEYVPYYAAQAWNAEHDNSMKVTPVIKGLTSLPQYRDTWLESIGYRGIKTTLARAAATGERARLHSTHPVPAWIRGVEFGKPRKGGRPEY